MDGVFDALVAAAPADVPGHGFADLVVRRFGILDQQRRCLHDLAGLAKAALRHVELPPGYLHGMITIWMKAFDSGDLAAADIGHGGDAGAHRLLVDHDGAGTAESLTAAELGARQADLIADKPK